MIYTEQKLQQWTTPLSSTEEQRAENTIRMIRSVVASDNELKNMDVEVFLQGSYANNTNVRTESDVDVCIMLQDSFHCVYPEGGKDEDYGYISSDYTFTEYRDMIKKAIERKFGKAVVRDGNKSIKIQENTYHVQADIVPCFQLRNYFYDNSKDPAVFREGIWFVAKDNTRISNYPKIHRSNGITKNNRTNYRYKKLIRIMKHIKNEMVDKQITDGNIISSYLVECLIWNVPDKIITGYNTWTETIYQTLLFLLSSIVHEKHTEWGEVSEMLYLFRDRRWNDELVKIWLEKTWGYLE